MLLSSALTANETYQSKMRFEPGPYILFTVLIDQIIKETTRLLQGSKRKRRHVAQIEESKSRV